MNFELPEYNMSSVNGDYMNTGSKYAPNIEPIQETNYSYSINEDRFEETYPPIGQLVPVGGDFILIAYIIIYAAIKIFKNKIRICKQKEKTRI